MSQAINAYMFKYEKDNEHAHTTKRTNEQINITTNNTNNYKSNYSLVFKQCVQ